LPIQRRTDEEFSELAARCLHAFLAVPYVSRRVTHDWVTVAEADSLKRKAGKLALTRSSHIYVFETKRITKSHDVHEHIGRKQHAARAPKQRDLSRAMPRSMNDIDASSDVQGFAVGQRLVNGDWDKR
jgi:hypothetical protein